MKNYIKSPENKKNNCGYEAYKIMQKEETICKQVTNLVIPLVTGNKENTTTTRILSFFIYSPAQFLMLLYRFH